MIERSILLINKSNSVILNKSYCAYIRVSTTRQGDRSVSLPEQREAITRYAVRQTLTISQWFEEQQTAAKKGRPIWMAMLKGLRQGKVQGVIIHKIDRSARNLKDWSDLGDLIDQGVEVHFANEALDLNSRGGRLSADIQAVVASDYIRNLREEAKKGIYGRLKQGFYPMRAPLGYQDNGAAKAKTIHPEKGPLVQKAFELYGSGKYSIPTLVDELFRLGLRNHGNGSVTNNGLWKLLKNPFYVGVIRIVRTNQSFEGNHEPLISKSLFERVQDIMHGRLNARTRTHDLLFRKFVTCVHCRYHLIGETHKGHVYYRCHQKACPPTSVREEDVEAVVRTNLRKLQLADEDRTYFKQRIAELKENWIKEREEQRTRVSMHLHQIADRLGRLTDAFLDQAIEKDLFEERKIALLLERRALQERLGQLDGNEAPIADELDRYIELTGTAYLAYLDSTNERKRRLLEIVTSNLSVDQKTLDFAIAIPFQYFVFDLENYPGRPSKGLDRIWNSLVDYLSKTPLPRPELLIPPVL